MRKNTNMNKYSSSRKRRTDESNDNRPVKSLQKMKQLELQLIKSYPKQVTFQCWLPGTPTKFTTLVTTGLINGIINVSPQNVTNFVTRFASTFVEYRIVRAKFRIRLFSSTNPGVLQFWMDEKSSNSPTLAEANERATLILNASAVDRAISMKWTCADPSDLMYVSTSSSFNPAAFKVYTNNANFGSSIVATDYLEVEPLFQFQFRGLMGV